MRIALGVLLLSFSAFAADLKPWHLDFTAGTQFPIDIAGRVTVEGPLRLQLSTSLGAMPGAYVDAINAVLVGFQVYSQADANLIAAAIKNSLVWRTQLGWRLLENWGFYFQLGYTLVALGGSLTGSEAITAATGKQPPNGESRVDVKAAAMLHMLGGEIGYQWKLPFGLLIRVAGGAQFTVASSTDLSAPSASSRAQQKFEPLLQAGEDYLNTTFKTYVHAPYISVQVGYAFF